MLGLGESPSQSNGAVPAAGSTLLQPCVHPGHPHLMTPQVLPMPTTRLTPPHHLQHLAPLSVPSPGPHLHQWAGQGTPPHHLHCPCFPSTPLLHWGSWRQHQSQKWGSQPGPGGCACFREGTCLAKAGWAGSPLAPPAPRRAPTQARTCPVLLSPLHTLQLKAGPRPAGKGLCSPKLPAASHMPGQFTQSGQVLAPAQHPGHPPPETGIARGGSKL